MKHLHATLQSAWLTTAFCVVLGLAMAAGSADAASPDKAVPIGVAQVKKRSPDRKIQLPGTVLAWAQTSLAAELDARVEQLFFHEGQHVKKGAKLVQLRTRPLELELQLAKAEKSLAATRLEELQAGFRQEEIEAARAALQKAKASFQLARIELKRTKKLYKEGVVSINNYDNAQAKALEAQGQFMEKKARLDELVAGPRIEKIKQQQARLAAAEARIELIEDRLQRTVIHAPFDGYVVKKETEVGEWLEEGGTGLTLIADSPVKVEVHLPQYFFDRVQTGAPAEIQLETRGDNGSHRTFQGKVVEKIQSGNPNTHTFPTRIRVENRASILAPGMLVQVHMNPRGGASRKLFVHKDALVRSSKNATLWVIRSGEGDSKKAEKLTVTPGRAADSYVALETVDGSLQEGDWVVVQGNERLRPGNKVKIIDRIR